MTLAGAPAPLKAARSPLLRWLVGAAAVVALMNASCQSCVHGEASDAGDGAPAASSPIHARADMSEVIISVGPAGLRPSEVRWTRGTPLSLVFVRTSDAACGNEVTLPDLGLTLPLPLNEKVKTTIPATTVGKIELRCGTRVGHVVVR